MNGAALTDTGRPWRLIRDREDRGPRPGEGAAGSGLLLEVFCLWDQHRSVCGRIPGPRDFATRSMIYIVQLYCDRRQRLWELINSKLFTF